MGHPAAVDDAALLSDCRVERTRGSGPGGQHRNKVETAVVLRHEPTGVTAQAGERRSQVENRRVALRRLRLNLAVAVRTEPGDEPSALWWSRVQGGRVVVNPAHADYAALLAEALDMLAACGFEPAAAAERLGCTASQLVKLMRHHPPALEKVNAARRERGVRGLK